MHNLAISLQKAGHVVTGSDDEIYNPARSRLSKYNLLPESEGWNPDRIHAQLDLIILGMHAREDNPELTKANKMKLPVMSFPEFIYAHSNQKKRIVVAGSHGKTTTTSMLLHVLKYHRIPMDYLVGAQLEGFETMVNLSDADLMVIEGDEYLSSAIDRVPKIWHYYPQISIITGIAWDHMNVFPTWKSYVHAFEEYLSRLPFGAKVFYFNADPTLKDLVQDFRKDVEFVPYSAFDHHIKDGITYLHLSGREIPLEIFGMHNMENLKAAYLVLKALGIGDQDFIQAITSFKGAAKRLQTLQETEKSLSFLDFAHAPSKVKATVAAVKELYPDRRLTACLELHTYSSLNKEFLPQYANTLQPADRAIIYYNEHTLAMKKMDPLSKELVKKTFNRSDLHVFTKKEELVSFLKNSNWDAHNLLLMTSGTFGGMNMHDIL